MKRCPSCSQILPSPAWNDAAYQLALEEFRAEWLARWKQENERVEEMAHAEHKTWTDEEWSQVLTPPSEPVPYALRVIGERRPEVEWLAGCPAEDRQWWGAITHGRDWLHKSFPRVTEEEWAAILA